MAHEKKSIDLGYLHIARDAPLSDYVQEFIPGYSPEDGYGMAEADLVLGKLAENGIQTYEQLMRQAEMQRLGGASPALDDKYVIPLYDFLFWNETLNKRMLVDKYKEAQEEIARLKQQQPANQLDKAAIDGREIAKSM